MFFTTSLVAESNKNTFSYSPVGQVSNTGLPGLKIKVLAGLDSFLDALEEEPFPASRSCSHSFVPLIHLQSQPQRTKSLCPTCRPSDHDLEGLPVLRAQVVRVGAPGEPGSFPSKPLTLTTWATYSNRVPGLGDYTTSGGGCSFYRIGQQSLILCERQTAIQWLSMAC